MDMDYVTSMYKDIKIHMCMYVCMYVCMYIFVYVSKYVFRIVLKDIRMYVCAEIALCMFIRWDKVGEEYVLS
jgi:hypothetical protein